jgi:2''-aminoglycoside nucleotidyltransferase
VNQRHLNLIGSLLDNAELRDMPLWIGGGWAIDARLGRITREHEDIDVTYPAERHSEFVTLLQTLGGSVTEETDYGFLADVQGVLVDCEPAGWTGASYEIDDTPVGSCPDAQEGMLDGRRIRCTSWEAILWDYFYYLDEVPQSQWRKKDHQSYDLACTAYGIQRTAHLHALFKSRQVV